VVASLLPANAGEAVLGAQFVAAHAQAMDCLRLARVPGTDTARALQCSAQAASMMRQAQSAMRLLLRGQEARQKIEADNVAVDKASWIEHCAAGLMAQALPGAPPLVMAEPPAPEPPAAEPVQEAEPEADPVAEAEEYAVLYPQRAALIRRLGRVPDNVPFGPPEDRLVRALVTSRTPTLLALDREAAEARAS
jgi:hypothetical protein